MESSQTWTVIGALIGIMAFFSTVLVGGMSMLYRMVKVEIGALRTDMNGRFDAVDARFNTVEQRLDAKIDHLAEVTDLRLTALESDMHQIKGHLLGLPAA